MLNRITTFLLNCIHLPFTDQEIKKLGGEEVRRIRMVNYIGLISIATMLSYALVYSIISIELFKPVIYWMLLGAFLCLLIMLGNKLNYHSSSKILIAAVNTILMSAVAMFFYTPELGFQTFLLLACFIPLFLWSVYKPFWLFFFIITNLSLYSYIEFLHKNNNAIINITENYAHVFKSTNVLVCFLGAGLAITVFLVLSNQKEEKLEQKTIELENSQHHQNLVYSIIAHDLRSPFNGLLGLSDLLITNYDTYSDDKKRKSIKAIHQSSAALNSLLENLLGWSKMQTGKLDINLDSIDAKAEVDQVITLLNETAVSKNIELINNLDSDIKVKTDIYMFSTIIRNLITNAIKFTHKGGFVKIDSESNSSLFTICIHDNGIGIQKKHLPNLFKISMNIVSNGTNSEKGSGLGLRLCYDFTKALGGNIWVESEANKGSKFYLSLNKG